MELFLWVVVVLLAVSTLGKLTFLAKGNFPLRDPKTEACDVVINFALIAWGIVSLVGLK